MEYNSPIELLVGKTLTKIVQDKDEVYFHCDDGDVFKAYHMQDCCENVRVWDVVGDFRQVIGSPITSATSASGDTPSDISHQSYESYTWTFHRISTRNGVVLFRWLGESNGYYSESVYFQRTHEPWSER